MKKFLTFFLLFGLFFSGNNVFANLETDKRDACTAISGYSYFSEGCYTDVTPYYIVSQNYSSTTGWTGFECATYNNGWITSNTYVPNNDKSACIRKNTSPTANDDDFSATKISLDSSPVDLNVLGNDIKNDAAHGLEVWSVQDESSDCFTVSRTGTDDSDGHRWDNKVKISNFSNCNVNQNYTFTYSVFTNFWQGWCYGDTISSNSGNALLLGDECGSGGTLFNFLQSKFLRMMILK